MRALVSIVTVALTIAYPVIVLWGLMHFRPRTVGLLALALLVPLLALRFRGARRDDLWAVLRVPLIIVALLGLGAALDDARLVMAMPVIVSLALMVTFASSLRGEVTLVERFARIQEERRGHTLTPAEVHHCRQVTGAWVLFLGINALVAAALALAELTTAWAVYTGGIAYALMGLMFVAEYVLRQYRFRRYGRGLHDRLLARLFPPREATEEP